jgi:hypothetical protein
MIIAFKMAKFCGWMIILDCVTEHPFRQELVAANRAVDAQDDQRVRNEHLEPEAWPS